jgi:hypothetical protein
MTTPNEGFYLKSFLIDSTVNTNDSSILPTYVGKHIRKFIGKPLILKGGVEKLLKRLAETDKLLEFGGSS